METLLYADPAKILEPFYLIAGAFALVGLLGVGISMRWIQARPQWAGEPARPWLAIAVSIVCLLLTLGFARVMQPIDFYAVEISATEARFLYVLPERAHTIPLEDIARVELLGNGRLAFWRVDPKGPHTDEDVEVTPRIFSADQKDRLEEALTTLEKVGWQPLSDEPR